VWAWVVSHVARWTDDVRTRPCPRIALVTACLALAMTAIALLLMRGGESPVAPGKEPAFVVPADLPSTVRPLRGRVCILTR
jgi:hypothetical protein